MLKLNPVTYTIFKQANAQAAWLLTKVSNWETKEIIGFKLKGYSALVLSSSFEINR